MRQVVSMNDLGPFSVVSHIVNDSFDIIDSVDAEVLDQIPLSFPLLSTNENG